MQKIDHPAIRFENVSKRFRYFNEKPQSVLESMIARVGRGRTDSGDTDLWALRDITFDVPRGTSIGLIGRNGSGKSTLLKVATRILRPTSGIVELNGRVSALLELGAGFHEDLTGRENIYLNGSVLGLNKQEIDARFDAIVDFSELHLFIDMPVKHYSSGMYMRLGFSVAVHCDPDILLIDEILAVGDSAFQRKCIDRICELKENGVTIVMVSHHQETLQKLCDTLVWIDQGGLREIGPTAEIVPLYARFMNGRGMNDNRLFARSGSHEAEITHVRFLDQMGHERNSFKTGETVTIEMAYQAHQAIREPEMGFAIFREDGVHINGPNNRIVGFQIDEIEGTGKLRYQIHDIPLLPGAYLVSAAIQDGHQPHAYDFHVQAYRFEIETGGTNEHEGVLALPATWEWEPDIK